MKGVRTLLVFSLLGLLMLSGCLKVNYEGKQVFSDDGTSTLEVKEYVGLNKKYFDSLGTYSESEDASSIALNAMLDYYESSSYSSFLCDMMEDEADSCKANSDGSLEATFKLSPGEFYEYKAETDWVNLVEKKTYLIEEVPFATYYVQKEAGSSYNDELQDDMADYVKDNIGTYLKQDAYCDGSYSYECDVKSMAGNTLSVELSPAYGTTKILWAACSDEDYSHFYFMDESEAKAELTNEVTVGKTVTSTVPATITLTCPSSPKTLVLGVEEESYYGNGTTTSVDTLDLMTKKDMEQEIIDSLDTSSSSSLGTTTTTPTDYKDYVINFKKAEVLGSDFDEFAELGDSSASYMSLDVSLDYTATFPGSIKSATVGGDMLDFDTGGKTLVVEMEDLEDLPKGALTVVVEKQISPLGVFTWVIPVVLVLGLIVLLVFLGRKG